MINEPDGSGWIGVAIYGGLPASIGAFQVAWQLGVIAVIAALAAFRYGARLDNAVKERRLEEDQRRSASDEERRQHGLWMAAWEDAWRQYDTGEIDHLDLVGLLEGLREY